jgi:hypothetical protein
LGYIKSSTCEDNAVPQDGHDLQLLLEGRALRTISDQNDTEVTTLIHGNLGGAQ